jgi:hypothetical protein
MSRFLPYVIPGSVVPGPLIHILKKGLTGLPNEWHPIPNEDNNAQTQVHPDVIEKQAEKVQNRLGDEDLVRKLKEAIQSEPITKAQPSNLDWRT